MKNEALFYIESGVKDFLHRERMGALLCVCVYVRVGEKPTKMNIFYQKSKVKKK